MTNGTSILVVENKNMLPGRVALKRRGVGIVWVGPLGWPWEDVECDTVVVHPDDYAAVKLRTKRNPT